jgi:hypothetical protein
MRSNAHLSLTAVALACALLIVAGCAKKEEAPAPAGAPDTTAQAAPAPAADTSAALNTMPVAPSTPPEHVEVQHVLIGFAGKIPGKNVTRTQAEAEKLAAEILARARKGEDFDQLVQKYTDDQWPGIYTLANNGVQPGKDEFPRSGMVKGFGDVAFRLSPGNIDVAPYDAAISPYGWHIIKRLK